MTPFAVLHIIKKVRRSREQTCGTPLRMRQQKLRFHKCRSVSIYTNIYLHYSLIEAKVQFEANICVHMYVCRRLYAYRRTDIEEICINNNFLQLYVHVYVHLGEM